MQKRGNVFTFPVACHTDLNLKYLHAYNFAPALFELCVFSKKQKKREDILKILCVGIALYIYSKNMCDVVAAFVLLKYPGLALCVGHTFNPEQKAAN